MADEVIGHMREKIVVEDDIEIVPRKRPEKTDDYLPFENVENGTTPMPAFGDGFNIHVTGLTHDERGYPDTNNPETHDKLIQRICNQVLNNRDKICSIKAENCEDADVIIVSYGAPVRSAVEAVRIARENNQKVGYVKIDTPWPFPDEQLKEATKNASDIIVVEMNLGQMYYEVDRVLKRDANVHLMGVIGGLLPTPDEILDEVSRIGGN